VATYRLLDGQSGRPGTGSTVAQPPAAGISVSGPFIFGLNFRTTPMTWLQGYWWWVANSGQDVGPVKCALWQNNGNSNSPQFIPGSLVTSGTLTAGQWNWIPLPSPLALAPGGPFTAAAGANFSTGISRTSSLFGSSDPYGSGGTNGINSGPLHAYVYDDAATWGTIQMGYSTAGSDPSANFPDSDPGSGNLYWLDVQVTDQPPANTTYRAFPNLPGVWDGKVGQNTSSISTQYVISEQVTLRKMWHYSPPGSVLLPTECGVWAESTQTLVAGTHLTSPAWLNASGASASPGDGWLSVTYGSPPTLAAGHYRPATFCVASSTQTWFCNSAGYFSSTPSMNFGVGGLTAGPLFLPDLSQATAPGQAVYSNAGTFSYPNQWDSSQSGEVHWIDIEVATPVTQSSGLLIAGII
jgi:hypothetical protein